MKVIITTVKSKRINMRCKIRLQNHKMWERGVRKCRFIRKCLDLYDHQSKGSRYNYVLTHLKTRVTTNQKHTIDFQKPKRKELKHNAKENHQTTKGKTKRRKELRRTTK